MKDRILVIVNCFRQANKKTNKIFLKTFFPFLQCRWFRGWAGTELGEFTNEI